MEKATLPTSQPFQHRAFAFTPSVANVLPLVRSMRSAVEATTHAKTKTAHASNQLNGPKARSHEPPMTAEPNQAPADPLSLAAAVARNDVDAVKALIKAGVDLRPENWYDTPVLVSAAAQGFEEIVQLLISARANVNNGYETLPLTSAAKHGHLNIVRWLLAAGAHLQAQETSGHTALMAAAATGQLAVVRYLVEKGAQLTATSTGETALSLAEQGGHQSVYIFLHQKMTPQKPPQQPTVTPQPPRMSVMDEMIASSTDELNKLLSEAKDTQRDNPLNAQ